MKNFTIRAFVLALAVIGAAATTVSSAASSHKHATVAAMTDPSSPAPICAPSDPTHCGMD